jgi:hypothetical protein
MITSSLWELGKELGLNLKRSKNKCPECHHPALSIEEAYCRCWWCGWRGDRVEFLVRLGGLSRAEALEYSGVGQEVRERSALYSQVLEWCSEYQEQSTEYLKQRGIDPECYPHGYCPPKLLEQRLTKVTLKRWGLASEGGYPLLDGRVIFPIYDLRARLMHFQGRALDPEDELRWLSTTGSRPISDYLFNGQRWAEGQKVPVLFICEGITDTLSLASLGLAAVGSFGIYPNFASWMPCLRAAEHVVLCYDGDRHPLGHPRQKQYISWPSVLENWSYVYKDLAAPAYALKLPPEYKDINEWLIENGNPEVLQRYLVEAPTVEEFVVEAGSLEAQVRILSAGKHPQQTQRWQEAHAKDWWKLIEELAWH